MSYEIIATSRFRRDIKKLVSKYPSLKKEYALLVTALEENPQGLGTPLGNNCFKLRIAIASKGKGKAGGARAISYVMVKKNTVFLLTIYDKSAKENISDKELRELLDQIAE